MLCRQHLPKVTVYVSRARPVVATYPYQRVVMSLLEWACILRIIVRHLVCFVNTCNIELPAKFYVRMTDSEAIMLQSVANPKRYLCIADDLLSGQVSLC